MRKFVLTPQFSRVMRKVVSAMAPWRWCLVGGRAVEIWSNPPQTPDIDCLAEVEDGDVPEVVGRFRAVGIVAREVYTGVGAPILFLRDQRERVDVDVLGAYDPLHMWVVLSAVRRTVGGVRIPVARPEGVVALKAQSAIDVGRPPGKKIRDRRAIATLAKSRRLDKGLLEGILIAYGWMEELRFLKSQGIV